MEEASGSGEQFTEDQMRDFQCPVCLEMPRKSPVYQCKNGHCVCRGCYKKLTNCPVCRVSLGNIRCLIFEKSLDNVKHLAAAQKKLRHQLSLANMKLVARNRHQEILEETLEQVLTKYHRAWYHRASLDQVPHVSVKNENKRRHQLSMAKEKPVARKYRQEATEETLHYEKYRWTRIALTILLG